MPPYLFTVYSLSVIVFSCFFFHGLFWFALSFAISNPNLYFLVTSDCKKASSKSVKKNLCVNIYNTQCISSSFCLLFVPQMSNLYHSITHKTHQSKPRLRHKPNIKKLHAMHLHYATLSALPSQEKQRNCHGKKCCKH